MSTTAVQVPHPETPAIRIRNLQKTYPGGNALTGVSFDVQRGTVHGLVGGNGCGKSTLVKSIAGVQSADPGGTVEVNGMRIPTDQLGAAWARTAGLRFVHQNPGIFPELSVADNIALGDEFPARLGIVRRGALRERAQRLLDRFEIDATPDTKMEQLRLADQTMVAIARALQDHMDGRSRIAAVVLDEPTAALPRHEVATLLDAMRTITASGVAVIYISHRLDEVLDVCNAITVLRDGEHVVTRSTDGLTESELVSLIVGRPLDAMYPDTPGVTSSAPVALRLEHVNAPAVHDVSFTLRAGEIVGIAGLLGAGRSELLQCLFGMNPATSGSITVGERRVSIGSVRTAMESGIAYVPEHRETDAAFLDLSVRENLSAADVTRFSSAGILRRNRERRAAAESIEAYGVKTAGDSALMSSLSGGNQQKVVLARWMRRHPTVLLLDEPTQGVDVGARADAYRLITDAVADGAAAILVSSDFEELADMSDRVLILSGGRITGEVGGAEIDSGFLAEKVFSAKELQS
ncbi:sugar ABC transporter ATP-binding protein [Mycolicibacterium canariasense]|uniref:sugar ABC transporter ATP-binding protein n=1 Tax=Mycolicibacterium canariasense TaxID=228230 RepID=UPI001911E938|nr:sugar ABC transporter ATP-binding protein [Mycolicibacterium canariasense]